MGAAEGRDSGGRGAGGAGGDSEAQKASITSSKPRTAAGHAVRAGGVGLVVARSDSEGTLQLERSPPPSRCLGPGCGVPGGRMLLNSVTAGEGGKADHPR